MFTFHDTHYWSPGSRPVRHQCLIHLPTVLGGVAGEVHGGESSSTGTSGGISDLTTAQVRILAVLLCTTGIALLAYMDGVQVGVFPSPQHSSMLASKLAI